LIACGYSYPVATTLAVLMTEAERQPVAVDGQVFHVPVGPRHCVQGAPTSPGLCNALVLRLDHRLAGFARRHDLVYTRYADDLTFSGNSDVGTVNALRKVIRRIVEEEGFRLNAQKTRLVGRARCQTVTGVVVNKVLGLSRQERRRLRAALHRLKAGTDEPSRAPLRTTVEGKLAYLNMLNPQQAARLRSAG
jgi:retron-type reverse transcriptase